MEESVGLSVNVTALRVTFISGREYVKPPLQIRGGADSQLRVYGLRVVSTRLSIDFPSLGASVSRYPLFNFRLVGILISLWMELQYQIKPLRYTV